MLWEPTAYLTPYTTAPLASRISTPPSGYHIPPILQPRPLHELDIEAQEAAILRDVLSVLVGYEGQYILFAKSYDPSNEKDCLNRPSFRISPRLNPSLQDLTTSIIKTATYVGASQAFIDVHSRAEFGLVNHALCAAIRKVLSEYLTLVG